MYPVFSLVPLYLSLFISGGNSVWCQSTERQTWLKDSFSFLRGHIRRKGVSKSSMFKSPQRPSAAAATASVPETSRDSESEMEISMTSDVTHHPSSTSPKRRQPTVATTSAADPVLDQFQLRL